MIDREKVIRHIVAEISIAKTCKKDFASVDIDMLSDALELLKEQEAKTGTWIEKTDYMGDTYYDCSVCGESWTTIDGTPWQNGMNYCPHCGAKMET